MTIREPAMLMDELRLRYEALGPIEEMMGERSYLGRCSDFDLSNPFGSIIDALGARDICPHSRGRIRQAAMLKHLRELRAQAEKGASKVRLPRPLSSNCSHIADLIGLDGVSERILAFVVLLQTENLLQEATDLLGTISTMRLYGVLSILLGFPKNVIRQALARLYGGWCYPQQITKALCAPCDFQQGRQ